jgi:L-alanine-DL-glutamate epimerase-like enolase superfamily enzyme
VRPLRGGDHRFGAFPAGSGRLSRRTGDHGWWGSLPLSTHLVPELSAHVLQVSSSAHLLEYLDIAAPLLAEPARVRGGAVTASRRPGAGVEWDEDAVVHDMGATGETLTWSHPQAG